MSLAVGICWNVWNETPKKSVAPELGTKQLVHININSKKLYLALTPCRKPRSSQKPLYFLNALPMCYQKQCRDRADSWTLYTIPFFSMHRGSNIGNEKGLPTKEVFLGTCWYSEPRDYRPEQNSHPEPQSFQFTLLTKMTWLFLLLVPPGIFVLTGQLKPSFALKIHDSLSLRFFFYQWKWVLIL